jgi:hypothetical protein
LIERESLNGTQLRPLTYMADPNDAPRVVKWMVGNERSALTSQQRSVRNSTLRRFGMEVIILQRVNILTKGINREECQGNVTGGAD